MQLSKITHLAIAAASVVGPAIAQHDSGYSRYWDNSYFLFDFDVDTRVNSWKDNWFHGADVFGRLHGDGDFLSSPRLDLFDATISSYNKSFVYPLHAPKTSTWMTLKIGGQTLVSRRWNGTSANLHANVYPRVFHGRSVVYYVYGVRYDVHGTITGSASSSGRAYPLPNFGTDASARLVTRARGTGYGTGNWYGIASPLTVLADFGEHSLDIAGIADRSGVRRARAIGNYFYRGEVVYGAPWPSVPVNDFFRLTHVMFDR